MGGELGRGIGDDESCRSVSDTESELGVPLVELLPCFLYAFVEQRKALDDVRAAAADVQLKALLVAQKAETERAAKELKEKEREIEVLRKENRRAKEKSLAAQKKREQHERNTKADAERRAEEKRKKMERKAEKRRKKMERKEKRHRAQLKAREDEARAKEHLRIAREEARMKEASAKEAAARAAEAKAKAREAEALAIVQASAEKRARIKAEVDIVAREKEAEFEQAKAVAIENARLKAQEKARAKAEAEEKARLKAQKKAQAKEEALNVARERAERQMREKTQAKEEAHKAAEARKKALADAKQAAADARKAEVEARRAAQERRKADAEAKKAAKSKEEENRREKMEARRQEGIKNAESVSIPVTKRLRKSELLRHAPYVTQMERDAVAAQERKQLRESTPPTVASVSAVALTEPVPSLGPVSMQSRVNNGVTAQGKVQASPPASQQRIKPKRRSILSRRKKTVEVEVDEAEKAVYIVQANASVWGNTAEGHMSFMVGDLLRIRRFKVPDAPSSWREVCALHDPDGPQRSGLVSSDYLSAPLTGAKLNLALTRDEARRTNDAAGVDTQSIVATMSRVAGQVSGNFELPFQVGDRFFVVENMGNSQGWLQVQRCDNDCIRGLVPVTHFDENQVGRAIAARRQAFREMSGGPDGNTPAQQGQLRTQPSERQDAQQQPQQQQSSPHRHNAAGGFSIQVTPAKPLSQEPEQPSGPPKIESQTDWICIEACAGSSGGQLKVAKGEFVKVEEVISGTLALVRGADGTGLVPRTHFRPCMIDKDPEPLEDDGDDDDDDANMDPNSALFARLRSAAETHRRRASINMQAARDRSDAEAAVARRFGGGRGSHSGMWGDDDDGSDGSNDTENEEAVAGVHIYEATFKYDGDKNAGCLSFDAGDQFEITDEGMKYNADWWKAKKRFGHGDNAVGLIPKTYVKVVEQANPRNKKQKKTEKSKILRSTASTGVGTALMDSDKFIYRATKKYTARKKNKKGELYLSFGDGAVFRLLDAQDRERVNAKDKKKNWFVRAHNMKTGEEGMVPGNLMERLGNGPITATDIAAKGVAESHNRKRGSSLFGRHKKKNSISSEQSSVMAADMLREYTQVLAPVDLVARRAAEERAEAVRGTSADPFCGAQTFAEADTGAEKKNRGRHARKNSHVSVTGRARISDADGSESTARRAVNRAVPKMRLRRFRMKYAFQGQPGFPENQLPVEEGDIVTIKELTSITGWVEARREDGKMGMVPYTYVNQDAALSDAEDDWGDETKKALEDAARRADMRKIVSMLYTQADQYVASLGSASPDELAFEGGETLILIREDEDHYLMMREARRMDIGFVAKGFVQPKHPGSHTLDLGRDVESEALEAAARLFPPRSTNKAHEEDSSAVAAFSSHVEASPPPAANLRAYAAASLTAASAASPRGAASPRPATFPPSTKTAAQYFVM